VKHFLEDKVTGHDAKERKRRRYREQNDAMKGRRTGEKGRGGGGSTGLARSVRLSKRGILAER
jgi:hypothetical protein